MEFTPEQHKTWAELFRRQLPRIEAWACREYLEGFDLLALPPEEIPSEEYLNSRITPASGWTIERTDVRYTDSDEWYRKFDQHIFLITDYMRSWEELDWTPEPDMFHDIFGHLPFFMHRHYAELQEMFAPAYLRATEEGQKESIKRLAWFSTEFGLIRENGGLKVFGTGLMSGGDEMERAATGITPTEPFSVENVIVHNKAVDELNQVLFVIDDVDSLKAELAAYFATI
jgi:phenylalanine-4-hydroxylase